MSTQPAAPEAPEMAAAAAGLPVDAYTLGRAIVINATFEQIAELFIGLQDGIAETGEMEGLIYALVRCEADDRGMDFTELAAGLTAGEGE